MRLKRLFLWIMLSAGIANIGAANYTPENVSISLKVPGNDARHYSLTLQKQQDGVYPCHSSEQLPLVITRQVVKNRIPSFRLPVLHARFLVPPESSFS